MTVPTSVWTGAFKLFGVDVQCHVLDDGQRVVEEESVGKLLDAMMATDLENPTETDEFQAFAEWRAGISQRPTGCDR